MFCSFNVNYIYFFLYIRVFIYISRVESKHINTNRLNTAKTITDFLGDCEATDRCTKSEIVMLCRLILWMSNIDTRDGMGTKYVLISIKQYWETICFFCILVTSPYRCSCGKNVDMLDPTDIIVSWASDASHSPALMPFLHKNILQNECIYPQRISKTIRREITVCI